MAATRQATHAGSWYPKSRSQLVAQLESFIEDTPQKDHASSGCRAIISPHAGYSYSGPTAAYGFKALDLSGIKRIFILGPSHHFYLTGCALSRFTEYATPLGNLALDTGIISELRATGAFDDMASDVDEEEHSIEMQLPYLKYITHDYPDIRLVPILVGNLDFDAETRYGKVLSPYLQDEHNVFVISSDFCHWGPRFSYTYYQATGGPAAKRVSSKDILPECPIWKSIEDMDREGMSLIEAGSHHDFALYLSRTRNTICGRHPIGVMLAALEEVGMPGRFRFLDYRQSNAVTDPNDGSVSYASGICCL